MTIQKMSDSEYFALDALDQTLLKKFMVSPLEYSHAKSHPMPTSSMRLGSAAHSLILGSGPDVVESPDGRTKYGKQRIREISEKGDIALNAADLKTVHGMRDMMGDYFTSMPGEAEMAMTAEDPWTGLSLKGKADYLPTEPIDGTYRILDYKTTSNSPEDFPRSAYRLGYYIQAAFYMRLFRINTAGDDAPLGFRFVVQSTNPPYDWMIWDIDEDSLEIEASAHRIDSALHDFSECQEMDRFDQGLDKTPHALMMSTWELQNLEDF